MNVGTKTEPTERRLMLRVVERAEAQADTIGGRSDRPDGVADVTDAVVPPAENAIICCRCHLLGEGRSGCAIQSAEYVLARAGLERLVERAEGRHAAREIARREIAAVEFAGVHHGEQIARLAAGGDDAVGHLDAERVAGVACDAVAQRVQRARVHGARGLIAGEVKLDHGLCMAPTAAILPWSGSIGGSMPYPSVPWRKPRINVVEMHGLIAPRPGAVSMGTMAPLIDRAFRSARGRPVILDIESPGGSPVQSDLIAALIRRRADEHEAARACGDPRGRGVGRLLARVRRG